MIQIIVLKSYETKFLISQIVLKKKIALYSTLTVISSKLISRTYKSFCKLRINQSIPKYPEMKRFSIFIIYYFIYIANHGSIGAENRVWLIIKLINDMTNKKNLNFSCIIIKLIDEIVIFGSYITTIFNWIDTIFSQVLFSAIFHPGRSGDQRFLRLFFCISSSKELNKFYEED